MSIVVVVGPPSDLSTQLNEYLGSQGHQVYTCTTSQETLHLKQKYHLDLVICEDILPDGLGVDLYKSLKSEPPLPEASPENKKELRFVLMTDNTDLKVAESIYDLGIEEILIKPISINILKLISAYLLAAKESFGSQDETYFSIPIDDILVSSQSEYSVYLKINDKYVCVTKTGQAFTLQRLQSLKQKGIRFIYLNSKDYAKYTDLQFAISRSIKQRPLDNAKMTKAYNHLISTIAQNSFVNQIDSENLNKALKAFENYTRMAFNNTQVRNLLITFTDELPDLAERSSILATLSSSIAHMWHWNSPRIQSRIVLGALLCDVGLKDYPHLHTKPRAHYTKEEVVEFEAHPLRSYKILGDIEGLPQEVLRIALEHHENGVGHGFPQKLIRSKVHSFSKLVNGAHEFIETLYAQKDKTNTLAALDKLFLHQRKLMSEQVLKSLYKLFDHDIPKELEGLLLPDEAARVF